MSAVITDSVVDLLSIVFSKHYFENTKHSGYNPFKTPIMTPKGPTKFDLSKIRHKVKY